MTSNTLLSLDLSTTCTGFAVFDLEQKSLVQRGTLRPSVKGISKMGYPLKQLSVMHNLSDMIAQLVLEVNPKVILIEEISGSKNRLSQKTLDGFHYQVLDRINDLSFIDRVVFYDVSGASGWRKHLDIRLTDADKKDNKEARAYNKKLPKGKKKLPVIGYKHLACRFANHHYGLDLDVENSVYDGDVADAVCMGHAYLKVVLDD